MTYRGLLALLFGAATLIAGGCQVAQREPVGDSGPARIPAGVLSQPDPVPRDEPLSASGNSLSYVVFGKRYSRLQSARGFDQQGVASWYGKKFHGRLTASGERYDMFAMTAAHKSLPLPTFARVTNLANNRSIVVRINDRGPFVDDRLIDLSYAAAAKLDMLSAGTAKVRVVTLSGVPGEPTTTTASRDAESSKSRPPAPQPLPYQTPQPIISGPTADLPIANKPGKVDFGVVQGVPYAGTTLAQRTPSLSNGHYLQLGAFVSFDAAGDMLARVRKSLPVEVFVAKQSDSELYRVQAGPFESLDRMTSTRQDLLSRYAIDAIVLKRDKAGSLCC